MREGRTIPDWQRHLGLDWAQTQRLIRRGHLQLMANGFWRYVPHDSFYQHSGPEKPQEAAQEALTWLDNAYIGPTLDSAQGLLGNVRTQPETNIRPQETGAEDTQPNG